MSFTIDMQELRQRAAERVATLATPATLRPVQPESGRRVATVATNAQDLASRLTDAINEACRLRGDDDQNRLALVAECMVLPPNQQADLIEHFHGVAAIYRAIVEGPAP